MVSKQRLSRSTPEAQGLPSSAIHDFVSRVDREIHELHSFMLVRHGLVIAEGWWSPHAPEHPHMLFSLSKSFTSTAIGLAVTEGLLSLDDRVLSFFPDEAPASPGTHLAAMCVRHLLSMSTGHAQDTMPTLGNRKDGCWRRAFLEQPVEHRPGTHFVYNTGATYMLSAILQKTTGVTLLDYLQPRLLEPLGIQGATWELSPEGISTGGFGMSITTEDIACFGQLYLQKGHWQGQMIVPETWVEEATRSHIDNRPNESPDWAQGYGYQFWRCRHNAYRGDGAFGQFCVVMPEQDAVLAITAGVGPMQPVLDPVWECLLPAFGTAPLAPNPVEQDALQRTLARLVLTPPEGERTAPTAAKIAGKVYTLDANDLEFERLSFDPAEKTCAVTLRYRGTDYQIVAGLGDWQSATVPLFDHSPQAVASIVWTAPDTLQLTLRFYETPFVNTFICRFIGDQIHIDSSVNVSFGPTRCTLEGKALP